VADSCAHPRPGDVVGIHHEVGDARRDLTAERPEDEPHSSCPDRGRHPADHHGRGAGGHFGIDGPNPVDEGPEHGGPEVLGDVTHHDEPLGGDAHLPCRQRADPPTDVDGDDRRLPCGICEQAQSHPGQPRSRWSVECHDPTGLETEGAIPMGADLGGAYTFCEDATDLGGVGGVSRR
jgi:hypothetical protein